MRLKPHHLPLILCFLTLPAIAAPRNVLVLDADKGSTAIILAEKPTSAAQFAAAELIYHLEKITGEQLPITNEPAAVTAPVKIAVGDTAIARSLGFPTDKLAPWEFLVAEKNGTIVLAGGDAPIFEKAGYKDLQYAFNAKPNGTCRAVYEFLEGFCGVHWYLPSEAGMVFPQTRKLVVKMDRPVRRTTDFRSTSYYPYQVNSKMYCQPATPELTGENVPDSDMEKWRKGLWSIPAMSTDMLPVAEVQRWLLRNKVGGEPYGPNHSFGNWLEKYGLEHPEWFSYKSKERIQEILAKGSKAAFNEFHQSGEPCFTAPGFYEQELTEARDFLDQADKRGRFFSIVPNDNYVWCQCDTCKPLYNRPVVDAPVWGGASGKGSFYVWDLCNRIARDLRKTHPNGWVGGIAYHDYMVPPRDFTLEPNVAVTICTYLGNWTPALRDTAAGLVKAWRDDAKCQWIGLWEYFCYSAMSQYQPMFPKVAPRLLGEDVKRMHKLGVCAEFIEAEDIYKFKDKPELGWAVVSNPIWLYLNTWTRFKVWDDTSRDVNKLLTDHYKLFYGPAAKPIQQFFDRIENRLTDMSLRGPKTFNDLSTSRQVADWEYLFPAEVMKELRGYADEATRLATAEPFKTRVTWVREGFLVPQEHAFARYIAQKTLRPAQKPRQAVCYRLASAPAIDGDGSDEAWKALPVYYLGNWRSGSRPKAETTFRLGYDDKFLYVLARCDDPNPAKLRAQATTRDGDVYADDCIEVHVTFDRNKSQRYQIIVNSKNVVQDLEYFLNEGGADIADSGWDCKGLVTGAKVDDKGFAIEMSIPLTSLGGAAKPGSLFYANLAREKYSASTERGQADEMQSWCATQNGFSDGKYFGRVLMSEGDGYSRFFSAQTAPPGTVLYKVNAENPWVNTPEAIKAVGNMDATQFLMKCPDVGPKGRTYGGFGVKPAQPLDVTAWPALEICFSKPNPNLMLEAIFSYTAEDGKDYSNYFIFSTFGEVNNAPVVFSAPFKEAHEREKAAPKTIKSITIYGVVEGEKTPLDCDYSINWVRVCKNRF